MLRRIAVVAACALLLGAPLMACLAPGEAVSPAEKQCCQEMAGQCGSVDMPASHSCCNAVVQPPSASLPKASFLPALDSAVAFGLPPVNLLGASADSFFAFCFPSLHGPPGSSSSPPTVLRI